MRLPDYAKVRIGEYHESIGYDYAGKTPDGNIIYVRRVLQEQFDATLGRFIRKSVVVSTVELDKRSGREVRHIGAPSAYIVPRVKH